jgi:hypothetical protein
MIQETEQDIAAKRVALTNILVRNQDVLQWYITKMFNHMPPMYVKVMFKAFALVDKEQRITQENMWALIPAFINSLPTEHFAVFLGHMGDFAECLHNEYTEYLAEENTEESSTANAKTVELVPTTRPTYDVDGADRIRQNDASEYYSTQSDGSTVSRSDTRYERGGTILPFERQEQTVRDQS